jgi:branched-chain amino acid transport system permease protein
MDKASRTNGEAGSGDIDMKLLSVKRILTILAFSVVVFLPIIIRQPYYQQILILWFLWSLVSSATNLTVGISGRLNCGIAGFYMVGAYTTTLLVVHLHLPWWLTVPAGGMAAGIAGVIVSVPCMKLGGTYLCIATLAFTYIMLWVGDNWGSVTGGAEGLHGVPHPDAIKFGKWVIVDFVSKTHRLYWLLGIVALSILSMYRLVKSSLGILFAGLRDNELLSEAIGINLVLVKTLTFGISSFFLGIAGGCYAYLFHGVEPISFSVLVTLYAFVMVFIGGVGTFSGPIIGAGIYVLLMELLRGTREASPIILGCVLIIILAFAPRGIVGTIWKLFEGKPNSKRTMAGCL